uniref:Uncharacterized protein n=1 Tax=Anguilla anguilla TaxID=7936 RepID=A0A0E9SZB7_ANGAN
MFSSCGESLSVSVWLTGLTVKKALLSGLPVLHDYPGSQSQNHWSCSCICCCIFCSISCIS